MPSLNLKHATVPVSLRGRLACSERLIPYFWAAIWIDSHRANLAASSNRTAVAAVQALYGTAEAVLDVGLDTAIARADYEALHTCLGAHLKRLNNVARQRGVDLSKSWDLCLKFITDVLAYVSVAEDRQWEHIKTPPAKSKSKRKSATSDA